MPNFPQPQRQDEPVVTDADLAALLAGTTDVLPGLRPVADVLAALTAEPSGVELAGEHRALAEFRRRAGAPAPAHRARRGTARRTSRLGVKVGASVTAAAVVLGGGAAAASRACSPRPSSALPMRPSARRCLSRGMTCHPAAGPPGTAGPAHTADPAHAGSPPRAEVPVPTGRPARMPRLLPRRVATRRAKETTERAKARRGRAAAKAKATARVTARDRATGKAMANASRGSLT
jgi:hypothetical protein